MAFHLTRYQTAYQHWLYYAENAIHIMTFGTVVYKWSIIYTLRLLINAEAAHPGSTITEEN